MFRQLFHAFAFFVGEGRVHHRHPPKHGTPRRRIGIGSATECLSVSQITKSSVSGNACLGCERNILKIRKFHSSATIFLLKYFEINAFIASPYTATVKKLIWSFFFFLLFQIPDSRYCRRWVAHRSTRPRVSTRARCPHSTTRVPDRRRITSQATMPP